jgi:8-oxo-dGTP diphosphatase
MSIPRHKLAVATMVWNKENKILLVNNHTRGWEFPGGYVDQQESIKAAAIREVKEESGIDIQLIQFYGIDQIVGTSTCVILFAGKSIGGQLQTSSENNEVGFFTVHDARKMMKLEAFRERLERCLNPEDQPFLNER